MSKKKKIIIAIVVILAIAALFGVVVMNGKKTANEGKMVQMAAISQENLTTSIFTNGKVLGNEKRTVVSDVSGKVRQMMVKEGDWVEAGAVLVSLDASDLENSLSAQEIQLAVDRETLSDLKNSGQTKSEVSIRNGEIIMKDALKAYEDKKVLLNSGAVSQSEVDAAKSTYERAKNDYETLMLSSAKSQIRVQELRVKATQVAIDKIKKDIGKTVVKAPISGTVTTLNVKLDELVATSGTIATIEDTRNLKIETNISEYDAYKISKGQKVKIKAEGINKIYAGTVSKIAPSATLVTTGQSSETIVKTEVILLDKETVLKPNFTVKLTINTASSSNALALPYEAIYTKKDGSKVAFFVDKESKLTEKKLNLGVEGDMAVQLLNTDVKMGDQVVLNPTEDLKTGDKVKAIEGGKK